VQVAMHFAHICDTYSASAGWDNLISKEKYPRMSTFLSASGKFAGKIAGKSRSESAHRADSSSVRAHPDKASTNYSSGSLFRFKHVPFIRVRYLRLSALLEEFSHDDL